MPLVSFTNSFLRVWYFWGLISEIFCNYLPVTYLVWNKWIEAPISGTSYTISLQAVFKRVYILQGYQLYKFLKRIIFSWKTDGKSWQPNPGCRPDSDTRFFAFFFSHGKIHCLDVSRFCDGIVDLYVFVIYFLQLRT